MEFLPEFVTLHPGSVSEAMASRLEHPGARMLGGGTDLIVNLRRGIGDDPPALIRMDGIDELAALEVDPAGFRIGAGVTLAALAEHEGLAAHHPVVAQAAGSVAGPTHRAMGTVGGNLCLDTRCIFYNQSEWWRSANDYCLKYGGTRCHVAPRSKVCYATFSGDLAPALLVLDAEVEIAGRDGVRTVPLADLYTHDGQNFLSLAPEEFVVAVRARPGGGLRSGYTKLRVRESIDFPVAGAAVALARDGDAVSRLSVAFTGTNPWPVLLEDVATLCGGPLDEERRAALDGLVRKQVMSMKTTFTSGRYRRNVARVLARRLVESLYNGEDAR